MGGQEQQDVMLYAKEYVHSIALNMDNGTKTIVPPSQFHLLTLKRQLDCFTYYTCRHQRQQNKIGKYKIIQNLIAPIFWLYSQICTLNHWLLKIFNHIFLCYFIDCYLTF